MSEKQKVQRFHEELLKINKDGMLVRVISYIFVGIFMMFMLCPAQEIMMEREFRSLAVLSGAMLSLGVVYYMQPYYAVVIDKVTESVWEKLLYLPMDKNAYKTFLLGILLGFLKKLLIAGLILQLAVSLLAFREITVWNILYPFAITFLVPLLLNLSLIMLR